MLSTPSSEKDLRIWKTAAVVVPHTSCAQGQVDPTVALAAEESAARTTPAPASLALVSTGKDADSDQETAMGSVLVESLARAASTELGIRN
jgi:hypothetical protein